MTQPPNAAPAAYGAPGIATADGFESTPQRLRRTLKTRPAEGPVRRALGTAGNLFRGDDYPRRLAEAAAGAQVPVSTGRRIAVIGSRGGAGKTTVAALLGAVYASMRTDAVTVLDNAPAGGTLALRTGAPDAPSLDAAAEQLARRQPSSLSDLAALLTQAGPGNLLVTGRRGTLPRPAGDGAASALLLAVSRYCPITVLDCGTGPDLPATRWALGQSHLAVFATPASVAGLEDAASYAAAWRRDPALAAKPLLVVVVQTLPDGPFRADVEARRLARAGIDAVGLGYDRHLAAGVEISLGLLARRTRLEAAGLAAGVLARASA
ncbi:MULTISPECIES: hypothetical protein [unclassified Arthrobacter]|uniref:hypothetical protein n=1 Tax=unclassified Arthrobacter TaxID=235627 RepID=UPI001D14DD1B|nr:MULTISPECIES: hypothetical protein [unclassified Arthrobacter]MCC3277294.1 hypothetical protein [Arthrobacter sp. zg-Y20]MCC9178961.1 hypothetical protein [Arthrobacter sp. zg-Y750]MDK1317454.1 hypothetical protein [Arthrobacter sp. zg.Y20]WIB07226.1 hypothetical protein QNO06_05745 [Arthrobacter sp. zg-Y20]